MSKVIYFTFTEDGAVEISSNEAIDNGDVFTAVAFGVIALVRQDYPNDVKGGLEKVIQMVKNGASHVLIKPEPEKKLILQ